ncbi:unnamed protein product [Amoebophrya sp. A120]|nr:unnamed protein product [Amoebophrya sp. A120]|eukprot:GSA120T00019054001.1
MLASGGTRRGSNRNYNSSFHIALTEERFYQLRKSFRCFVSFLIGFVLFYDHREVLQAQREFRRGKKRSQYYASSLDGGSVEERLTLEFLDLLEEAFDSSAEKDPTKFLLEQLRLLQRSDERSALNNLTLRERSDNADLLQKVMGFEADEVASMMLNWYDEAAKNLTTLNNKVGNISFATITAPSTRQFYNQKQNNNSHKSEEPKPAVANTSGPSSISSAGQQEEKQAESDSFSD